MTCLSEDQLLHLLDGGIAPNQADSLNAHLKGCAPCRGAMNELLVMAEDLKAPVSGGMDAHIANVLARVARTPDVVETAPPRWRWTSRSAVTAFATSALAIAAALLFLARTAPESSRFTARGFSSIPTLARDVGVSLFTGVKDPVRLLPGAHVTALTSFTAAYTNIHPRPAYVLVFAVDAASTVHWLYPAYVNPAEDPPSVPLPRAEHEALMPTSVILDTPAAGDLRVVSIATESPRHVSDVEGRPAAGLTLDALARAFPQAAVSELPLHVEPTHDP